MQNELNSLKSLVQDDLTKSGASVWTSVSSHELNLHTEVSKELSTDVKYWDYSGGFVVRHENKSEVLNG